MIMASYKAFGDCVCIYNNNEYQSDLLGFESVRMFENPADITFKVFSNKLHVIEYLSDLSNLFAQQRPEKYDEHISFANESMIQWYSSVAGGARNSRHLKNNDRKFLRAINDMEDPLEFFLHTLPVMFGNKKANSKPNKMTINKSELKGVIETLVDCRKSIDGLIKGYIRDAIEVIQSTLTLERTRKSSTKSNNTIEGIGKWIACFNIKAMMKRNDLKYTDKRILEIAVEASKNLHTPETLARVFSSILLQRSIEKWQDNTADQLRKELRECRSRIEATALDVTKPSNNLIPIIDSRINFLNDLKYKIINSRRRK